MIFIDSWVWIEFFSEGEKAEKAEEILEELGDKKAVITPTVLMEVKYRVRQKAGKAEAENVVATIQSFENLQTLPITADLGLYAADLRQKYYDRENCEFPYADAIHVAAAAISDCEKLYSGDPDFEEIKEVETEVI